MDETQEQRNKIVLGTLITWLAQSGLGVLSIGEASILLTGLDPVEGYAGPTKDNEESNE